MVAVVWPMWLYMYNIAAHRLRICCADGDLKPVPSLEDERCEPSESKVNLKYYIVKSQMRFCNFEPVPSLSNRRNASKSSSSGFPVTKDCFTSRTNASHSTIPLPSGSTVCVRIRNSEIRTWVWDPKAYTSCRATMSRWASLGPKMDTSDDHLKLIPD